MNALPKPSLIRRLWLPAVGLLLCFGLLQFVRPELKNPPVTADFQAPPDVKPILQRACYDCHSNETKLKWFDKVQPAFGLVASHVRDGRRGLNFSTWDRLATPDQKAKLFEALNQMETSVMPPKSYLALHREAALSAQDVATMRRYVASLVVAKPADSAQVGAAARQFRRWQSGRLASPAVHKALNGVAYNPDYKNWEPISTTERFDNGTMRVIFGNKVAIQAIHEKHINPWPNGTILAKVAWAQLADANGNVCTGEFKQIEYMIKDSKKYAATEGWGWARFKTPALVPYGKTALFTTECINCHRPVAGNDFVFTPPLHH
jgi:mono/diheme cytochrome c family protein